jgi:2-polyprenyl-6-methoxyphenol hydroxylase-like FAD-dependent oxidoreductase
MRAVAVVVGGGPAGAASAIALARAGWETTLLERRAHVVQKVCGECLSPPSRQALERLGVWRTIDPARVLELRGVRLVSPAGRSCLLDFLGDGTREGALAIPRPVLDQALLDGALEAGVRVRTGVQAKQAVREGGRWRLDLQGGPPNSHGDIRADLLVAADGRHSPLARSLGLAPPRARHWLRHAAVMAFFRVPQPRDTVEMHVTPWGYVGLNPLPPGDRLNVIAVLSPERLKRELGGSGQAGLLPLLEKLARGPLSTPSLRRALAGASPLEDERPLAVSPLAWVPARVANGPKSLALVGDSAGFVDPFTGEGLYHALASALKLGELLEPCADTVGADGAPARANALEAYASWHARAFKPEERFCGLLQRLLPHGWLTDYGIAQLARKPALAATLAEAVADRLPIERVLSPLFWARWLAPWGAEMKTAPALESEARME